jgi:hypothetical protein
MVRWCYSEERLSVVSRYVFVIVPCDVLLTLSLSRSHDSMALLIAPHGFLYFHLIFCPVFAPSSVPC